MASINEMQQAQPGANDRYTKPVFDAAMAATMSDLSGTSTLSSDSTLTGGDPMLNQPPTPPIS